MLCRAFLIIAPCVFANNAFAHDWFVVNDNLAQCVDISFFAVEAGTPQLASPEALKSFYESIGDSVTPMEVKDSNGLPIIELLVFGSNGALSTAFSYYPTLSDCKGGLAYDKSQGFQPDPNDLK